MTGVNHLVRTMSVLGFYYSTLERHRLVESRKDTKRLP